MMEKKRNIFTVMMAAVCTAAMAQFTTAGNGTTYTFETLAQTASSGVTKKADKTYVVQASNTIAEGDHFKMDDGVTVLFDKNVTLTIKGDADFQLSTGSTFDAVPDVSGTLGAAICIMSKTTTELANCSFYTVGVELMAEGATNVRHCNFFNHDGVSAAALYFITDGAESTVEHCYFEECQKAAIGTAANAPQPLVIKDCTLVRNSRANSNVPQMNLTASSHLEISGCEVTGDADDASANSMVGGIGISNFMAYSDTRVNISRCNIAWNRYGIGTVGPVANLRIDGCTLTGNNHEANPMNGGSGISLYDPYQQTCAVISGNHIEGSLWGVTIIGCQDVNLGQPASSEVQSPGGNVFKDNGNGGQRYDLYNNSTLTVYAQNNTWNVNEQTQEEIEQVIFHKADDDKLGEVIYWPAAASAGINGQHLTPNTQHPSPNTQHPTPVYDLNGLRRATPVKGINIVHGKKVVH